MREEMMSRRLWVTLITALVVGLACEGGTGGGPGNVNGGTPARVRTVDASFNASWVDTATPARVIIYINDEAHDVRLPRPDAYELEHTEPVKITDTLAFVLQWTDTSQGDVTCWITTEDGAHSGDGDPDQAVAPQPCGTMLRR
jgi:hypothetical protein